MYFLMIFLCANLGYYVYLAIACLVVFFFFGNFRIVFVIYRMC